MDWGNTIEDIVHKFHQKYGTCKGVIWVWALCSPLYGLFKKDTENFHSTSDESWADKLYEWCNEDGLIWKLI